MPVRYQALCCVGACMCGVRMHTHVWVLKTNIQNFSWAKQKVKDVALWQMVDPELGQSSHFSPFVYFTSQLQPHPFLLPSLSLFSIPLPTSSPSSPVSILDLSCCRALELVPCDSALLYVVTAGLSTRDTFSVLLQLKPYSGPDCFLPNYKGQDSKNDLRRNVGKVVVNGRTGP